MNFLLFGFLNAIVVIIFNTIINKIFYSKKKNEENKENQLWDNVKIFIIVFISSLLLLKFSGITFNDSSSSCLTEEMDIQKGNPDF